MNFPLEILLTLSDFCQLTEEKLYKLQKFGEMLLDWNQKINLTAINEPHDVVIKHFYDSLTVLKAVKIKENSNLIDVGTGAGFPGVVLKIARPDIKLTLLDGTNKKVTFLKAVTDTLDLPSDCIHGRAEELGKNTIYREQYDYVTARAVAPLNKLSEYCIPLVKIGGKFISMKADAYEELEQANMAINTFGGTVQSVVKEELPDKSKRSIIIINKVKGTDHKYPRISSKINKEPI